MILTMRLAFTAHATIIAAPRHHNCCYHNVPPNGRLAPPSFPACSCPPLSMAETFNPATSPGGAVGYRQRRQRRAQRLRLKGSTGNGSDCGGGGGGGGGGRTGPGFPNSNTLFHSMSTKRSRLVVMNSGLLGDPQQAVPDEGPSLGLGLVGGGGAIRKDVGSDAGRDGDVGEVLQSEAARAYCERKREALRKEEEGRSRDLCNRCRRAQRMCLCSALPAEALPTSTRFVILQHPAETKRRITGTVPLVLHCLSNCCRVVMRADTSEASLREALGVGDRDGGNRSNPAQEAPLLLYPFPEAEYLEDIAADREETVAAPATSAAPSIPAAAAATAAATSIGVAPAPKAGKPLQTPQSATPPPAMVIVLIDGTWSQAKQILSRHPFLSSRKPSLTGPGDRGLKEYIPPLVPAGVSAGGGEGKGDKAAAAPEGRVCRAVKFRSAGTSGYGFRREPSKECISTLESVAYTLEVLEGNPEGLSAAAYLRKAFSAMVKMQLDARDANGNPRFNDRKAKTSNRRSTPKKEKPR